MILKVKYHNQIIAEYEINNTRDLLVTARKFKGGLEAVLLAPSLLDGVEVLISHITSTGPLEAWIEDE